MRRKGFGCTQAATCSFGVMNSIKPSRFLIKATLKRGQNLEQSTQKRGKTNHSIQNRSVPFFIFWEPETGFSFIGCQLPTHYSRQTERWKGRKREGTFQHWVVREAHPPDVLGEAWESKRERERWTECGLSAGFFKCVCILIRSLLLHCAHV